MPPLRKMSDSPIGGFLCAFAGLVLALPLCNGCASGPAPLPSEAERGVPSSYIIGPEDVLDVLVWNEEGLGALVPVLPDGSISLPLAGVLQAAGMTVPELEQAITNRLERFIQDSPVTVVVREVNHARFYIIGEVGSPGAYTMRSGNVGLLQALAIAGGLTDFADRSRILVIRVEPDGRERRFRINYSSLISSRGGDFRLLPGDTVVVP